MQNNFADIQSNPIKSFPEFAQNSVKRRTRHTNPER